MKRLAPLFLALFLIVVAAFAPAQAQEGLSTSYTTEVQFPTELTFNLTAESAADITEIYLRYKINTITTVTVTSVVQLEFDSAPLVETGWTWEMKKMLGSLPPGAEIQYSWRIQDASGYELETPWDTVQFNDDRYSWNSLTEGDVTLFWYRGGLSFAKALLAAANEALERLANDTGAHLDRAVEVYIYAGSEDLRGAMVFPQEWVGGIAFSEYGTIAIGVEPTMLAWGESTLAHEMAHLITGQMTSNPYSTIPTWLSEGLSMYAEGDMSTDFKLLLDRAISEDRLISVQTLSSNFPSDFEEATLSYAESYSLVEFLIHRYDSERILLLLNIFKQGSSYDDALLNVYDIDTTGLDDQWRQSLGLEPRTLPPGYTPQTTPTATPRTGLFGCQATSSNTSHSGFGGFSVLGLLIIGSIGETILVRARRGKK